MRVRLSLKLIMFYHIFFLDIYIIITILDVKNKQEKEMEQDQIISSLFNMLQKSNNEKINMQLTIDKLTAEIEALKKEEKKENKNSEK
jgi:hypothetical protein